MAPALAIFGWTRHSLSILLEPLVNWRLLHIREYILIPTTFTQFKQYLLYLVGTNILGAVKLCMDGL